MCGEMCALWRGECRQGSVALQGARCRVRLLLYSVYPVVVCCAGSVESVLLSGVFAGVNFPGSIVRKFDIMHMKYSTVYIYNRHRMFVKHMGKQWARLLFRIYEAMKDDPKQDPKQFAKLDKNACNHFLLLVVCGWRLIESLKAYVL